MMPCFEPAMLKANIVARSRSVGTKLTTAFARQFRKRGRVRILRAYATRTEKLAVAAPPAHVHYDVVEFFAKRRGQIARAIPRLAART
jgi:hypothetical protein